MPTPEQRKKLQQTAISAWEAYKCCVRGRNTISQFLNDLAWAADYGLGNVEDGQCAFVPPGGRPYPIVMPTETEVCVQNQGGPGGLVKLLATITGAVGVALSVEFLADRKDVNVARALQNAAEAIRRQSVEVCLDCVEKRRWGQANARKRYYGAESKDGQKEQVLNLRLGELH